MYYIDVKGKWKLETNVVHRYVFILLMVSCTHTEGSMEYCHRFVYEIGTRFTTEVRYIINDMYTGTVIIGKCVCNYNIYKCNTIHEVWEQGDRTGIFKEPQ